MKALMREVQVPGFEREFGASGLGCRAVMAAVFLLLAFPAAGQSRPGEVFRDCSTCPEMVVVPGGTFMMGSPDDESGRYSDEGPQHKVTIPRFAVGRYEVTFDEWDACHAAGGCIHNPGDNGWGRGRRPVIIVSWPDALGYARWLSRETGEKYRLLSESEWEYAARGGASTARPWGKSIGIGEANCGGCGSQWDGTQTAPVGSFEPNNFGLYDVMGNVWEWVLDCWHENYGNAPSDNDPWLDEDGGNCSVRVLRGGSWISKPEFVRSANRSRSGTGGRNDNNGFRIARTLP